MHCRHNFNDILLVVSLDLILNLVKAVVTHIFLSLGNLVEQLVSLLASFIPILALLVLLQDRVFDLELRLRRSILQCSRAQFSLNNLDNLRIHNDAFLRRRDWQELVVGEYEDFGQVLTWIALLDEQVLLGGGLVGLWRWCHLLLDCDALHAALL